MAKRAPRNGPPGAKKLGTQQSVDAAVWSICDVMRRGNVASALQYVPELTWILFLRILDETEEREALEAKVLGHDYTPSISHPHRWDDWARPIDPKAPKTETNIRRDLTEQGQGKLLEFVNARLIPHLKALRNKPDATPRQKVIAEILSGVERVRIDTETNLLEVLDKVHEISQKDIDPTHVFALSQVYEGLLLKMGEKGSDAGQFFTPREVIRTMVRVLDPKVGERVFDPCCGTGGFLAQTAEYMVKKVDEGEALPRGMSQTPLTLDDFKEFFDLLPKRADSQNSWTMDFTARRRKAAEDACPFRQAEADKKAAADALKYALTDLKRARPLDEGRIAETEAAHDAATRAARDAAKKAEAIESAVYDLKAVNPGRKTEVDQRTPAELLDVIESKGRDIAEALAALRQLDAV